MSLRSSDLRLRSSPSGSLSGCLCRSAPVFFVAFGEEDFFDDFEGVPAFEAAVVFTLGRFFLRLFYDVPPRFLVVVSRGGFELSQVESFDAGEAGGEFGGQGAGQLVIGDADGLVNVPQGVFREDAVLGIAGGEVNPRIRHMRRDLAGEVGLDVFLERNILGSR